MTNPAGLEDLSKEIAGEVTSGGKATLVDPMTVLAIASLVLEVLKFLFNWWQNRKKTAEEIKTYCGNIGPIKHFLIKNATKKYLKRIGKSTDNLDEVLRTSYNKISSTNTNLVAKFMGEVPQVDIKASEFPTD